MVGTDLRLVVGLGNPGEKYAGNRHNLGAMVLDRLAERGGLARFTLSPRPQVLIGSVRLGTGPGGAPGPLTILAKPTTYMNLSGGPVRAVAARFELPPDRIVVVHDDLDLSFGTVRLKMGGGEGGHNGLKDISRSLGTKDYLRVRCGIGRPPGRMDAADYVLRDFAPAQRAALSTELDRAADAVEQLILQGLTATQLTVHTRDREEGDS
ncbi:MAG: aminoacyl-tRNA hydrolase [Bifidobacteriaceae bacterium]|jgi:PTH1 family peptidyl-tRNA hydrolase|nr:aminoacyl-tRNA hydrolase [Bifidobacteriaceae bacterium]